MDRNRVEGLFERYGFAVHRRCLRILGSSSEADDALQEVFVRVMRYGDSHRGDASLPWLYTIASRVCFDRLNRRKRFAGPDESERVLAAERATETGPVSMELTLSVAKVLEKCRNPVREVAVLYHFDQLTQEEIAAHLGISRKTVKKRLAQFMERARDHLVDQPVPRMEAL